VLSGSTGGIGFWESYNSYHHYSLTDCTGPFLVSACNSLRVAHLFVLAATQGKCSSLYYDDRTNLCVASFRKSPHWALGLSYVVFELASSYPQNVPTNAFGFKYTPLKSLESRELKTQCTTSPGTTRSRTLICSLRDNLFVVSSDEKEGSVCLWNPATNKKTTVSYGGVEEKLPLHFAFVRPNQNSDPKAIITIAKSEIKLLSFSFG